MSENEVTVRVLTNEELDGFISDIEEKYPWFKTHYEDDEICSCCKIDYNMWDWDEIETFREYDKYRFLRGDWR